MDTIDIRYRLSLKEYREAVYFGTLQQRLFGFRMLAVVMIVAVGYAVIIGLGLIPMNPFPFYIAAAELIWLLLVLANAELGIRRYMKTADCLLGKTFDVSFSESSIRVRMPQKKSDILFPIKELYRVIELHDLYMIYVDGLQTYLVSKKPLTTEQQTVIRRNFRTKLGKAFHSRFDRNAAK